MKSFSWAIAGIIVGILLGNLSAFKNRRELATELETVRYHADVMSDVIRYTKDNPSKDIYDNCLAFELDTLIVEKYGYSY